VNHPKATLVIEIAGKTFDADISAEAKAEPLGQFQPGCSVMKS
jgi:hypothetical protein